MATGFVFECGECGEVSDDLLVTEYVRLLPSHHWVCSKCIKTKFKNLMCAAYEKVRKVANGWIIKTEEF
jgi:hypothetical protein